MENYLSQKDDVGYYENYGATRTEYQKRHPTDRWNDCRGSLVGPINFINLVMTNIITCLRHHAEHRYDQPTASENGDIESLSYVLRAESLSSCIWILGVNLGKGTGRRTMYNMMTFQTTLLPALVMLFVFFGIGVYRSRCRTPTVEVS